jgi:hypothetical protein
MQQLRCAATDLKTSQRFLQHASHKQCKQLPSTGTTSAAQSTARAPLQPHLHSLHATPRHTLHHHLSPAPRHEGHVHIGRRGGKSLARERHTAEHEAHSPTRRTLRDNAAEGRQRLLPKVVRKKPLVACHLKNLSGLMICARSCLGDCIMPSGTRASDTVLPLRRSGNERVAVDIIFYDATFVVKSLSIFCKGKSCLRSHRVAEGGEESDDQRLQATLLSFRDY